MRTIVHLDMDAFYASIELQRRPELSGKAMVVAGSGARSVVTTASYEAREYGIGSAMPLSRARRLCPDLVVVAPDFQTYRKTSQTIMTILRSHVDRVEVVGLDEAYLDLTGFAAPHAAIQRIRAQIQAQTGLTCSIGKAPNKLLAKIASGLDKPTGTVTLSQEEAVTRFANFSPSLIPGIGPKTVERLAAINVQTIADLQRQPLDLLQARFGERSGAYLLRRAHFEDSSAVEPVRQTKSQSTETTFDVDISDTSQLNATLHQLAVELCKRLQRRSLRGKNIAIKVRLADWTTVTRATTLGQPTNDPVLVSQVARQLLATYAPTKPVRLLGVRAAGFCDAPSAAALKPQLNLEIEQTTDV